MVFQVTIFLLLLTCVALYSPGFTNTQTLVYQDVVSGFPLNRGVRVPEHFWDSYQKTFQVVAETIRSDSMLIVELTGMVDGTPYIDRGKDDPLNGGLATSRCIAVKQQLVSAGVPENRIVFRTPDKALVRGPKYRKVTITVTRVTALPYVTRQDLDSAFAAQPKIAPVVPEKPDTSKTDSSHAFVLSLGLGGTTTAFSGTPYVNGTISWKQIVALDAQGGICPWTFKRSLDGITFTTRSRFIGAHLTVYPKQNYPLGITAGYERHERLNTANGEYVQRHECFTLGLHGRLALSKYFDLVADVLWLPGERYTYPNDTVTWPTDRLRTSLGLNLNFGGRK